MTLDQAIERLYDLHPGVTPVAEGAPHERPHQPLLILAVLDLINEGERTRPRVPFPAPSPETYVCHPLAPVTPNVATIQALGSCAANHQVLIFTCHPNHAGELQSFAGAKALHLT